MRAIPLTCLILASSIATVLGAPFTSTGSGLWNATNTTLWDPAGNPQTGSTDSISILTGHTVIFGGTSNVGLPGSNDLGAAGGQSININGGVLSQTPPNFFIRIGHGSDGTVNINDGRFHFTNSTTTYAANLTPGPNLQVGLRGGSGFINIGDGTGAAGSAVLNLRDIVDGTANTVNVNLNLGASETNQPNGIAGKIVINSDGVLEGDVRSTIDTVVQNPHIRVGQASSDVQSSILVNAGGQLRAHGNVEIAAAVGSKGLIHLTGAGARMDMDGGEFTVGFNGTAALLIENGGVFSRVNTPAERLDIRLDTYIGRSGPSNGSVVVQSGGEFLRGAGGTVGDLRIGFQGTGSMTVNDGGLVRNESNNYDWVGQQNGGNGTLTINTGGTYRISGDASLIVGVDPNSTGLVVVDGGALDISSNTADRGDVRIGQNGTGTFRQISGTSNMRTVVMAENNGTAAFDLRGGTVNVRSNFFMGGAGTGSAGTGTATGTQSGGTLTVGGPFVVGLATGHTASYTLTGGVVEHTGSDTSIGESGTGTLTVGINGTFADNSGGQFFVGRNAGSAGTMIVDGEVTRLSLNGIRVGNGDSTGVDNTNAPGLLGGTGEIYSNVRIGALGTLTGGTSSTIGTLSLEGDLSFSTNGLLYANLGAAGSADRISLTGAVNITGARLDGTWDGGIANTASRYWLLVNDGDDFINGTFSNVSDTSPNAGLFPSADAWATIGGQEFAVFYSANFDNNSFTGGNDLMLAPVPEPGTALLLGCGAVLGLSRRRRKNS